MKLLVELTVWPALLLGIVKKKKMDNGQNTNGLNNLI